MSGTNVAWLAGGILVGFVAALFVVPANTNECCNLVASGIRDKATGALGAWAGPAGDSVNLWQRLTGVFA